MSLAAPQLRPLDYQTRRQQLLAQMDNNALLLVPAAVGLQRNADTDIRFRQASDYWYLTGIAEASGWLLLHKDSAGAGHSYLVVLDKDPQAEIWHGRRLGAELAKTLSGVDEALPLAGLNEQVLQLLNGCDTLYYPLTGVHPRADNQVSLWLNQLSDTRGAKVPARQIDYRPLLAQLRLYKSPSELAMLRHAIAISTEAHHQLMRVCKPGMYEYQLEGHLLQQFCQHGALHQAYPAIIAAGSNACILHYVDNNAQIGANDWMLVDAGCEWHGYAADITRTFPANGRFEGPAADIYRLVLSAQEAALAQFAQRQTIAKANQACIKVLTDGLLQLGLLQGELNELIEQQAYRRFYMHGLSHWLGLDVHDVGDYGSLSRDRELTAGMVLTVEPGLYIAPDDLQVASCWRGIGVRIEDNIVITANGYDNLTAAVVKQPDDIVAMMRG